MGSKLPKDMGRALCNVGELGADLGLEILTFKFVCSLKLSASFLTFNLIPLYAVFTSFPLSLTDFTADLTAGFA